MLRVASPLLPIPRAGSAPSPRRGVCDPRASQGSGEGARTGRTRALDARCRAPRRAPILKEPRERHRRGRPGGGGSWARGAGEREAGRPRARFGRACRLGGCGASTACDRGPGSVSEGARAAGRQGEHPRASGSDQPRRRPPLSRGCGPGRRPSPGLRGDPLLALPAPSPGVPLAQSPTGQAPISPTSDCRAPLAHDLPTAGRRPVSLGPTVAPPHGRHAPTPSPAPRPPSRLPWGHASPGGCTFASLRAS